MNVDLEAKLESVGQQHLIAHWGSLTADEQAQLTAQIEQIDFDLVRQLVEGHDSHTDWTALSERASAPPAFRLHSENNLYPAEKARNVGQVALREGKLGVILVAGGQGSRLGFEHPKGMYEIGPVSNRSLFQMHIEQLRAISTRYEVSIPLYLMTSPATHAETVEFLEKHDRFGLSEDDLTIFCQGTMPAVDAETGKLLLDEKYHIFESPDGHGGTLAALQKHGCLADMQRRGIEQLYYFQVDNPLAEICQLDLIGYHLLSDSELTTQVIAKHDPLEKVGNVVMVDDRMMVIEYSDLPAELATRTNSQGEPIFWAGSIAVHVFSVDFLRRAAEDRSSLPFHRALKKVSFIGDHGQLVTPDEPNAIKFEKFIFDLLPSAKNPIVVEADPAEVFAPLKNASGAPKDTPETTRAAIVAKSRRILEAAGAIVNTGVAVELNPLFALDVAQLKQHDLAGTQVTRDTYFSQ